MTNYKHHVFSPHALGGSAQFHPAPEAISEILTDLGDAHASFAEIARRHNTTPELLALWMARPDIRERIEATDRIVTWRTRLVASESLSVAIDALAAILSDFNRNPDHPVPKSRAAALEDANEPSASDLRTVTLNLRRSENARRAAAALIRLANLPPNTLSRVRAAEPRATRDPRDTHVVPVTRATGSSPRWAATDAESSTLHVTPDISAPATAPQSPSPTHLPAATTPPALSSDAAPTPTANSTIHPAAFEHLITQLAEVAATNPTLIESIVRMATSNPSGSAESELAAPGPREHWP